MRRALAGLALAVAALATGAAAQPPAGPTAGMAAPAEYCPAGAPALPPELAGWPARTPSASGAASASAPALTLGRGVDAALGPASVVTFAAPPGRPVGAPADLAGLLSLTVVRPGTYAVALSAAAWIDVVDARGAEVASTAHGRGPPARACARWWTSP